MHTRLRLLPLLLLAAGCAVPASFPAYLENRRQDLIDALHVDIGVVNVGAVVYALPFMAGLDYQTGLRSRTQTDTLQIGLGGPRILGHKGLCAGILFPAAKWDDEKPAIGQRPKRAPSGFSAGASAGFILGLAVEADAIELVDFVVGLLCLDLMEDDSDLAIKASPITGLSINISPTAILMAGKALTIDQLRLRLADLAKADPKTLITIGAASTTPAAQIAAVLEACKQASLTNIVLSVITGQ